MYNDLKRNGSGYYDPTAKDALMNVIKSNRSFENKIFRGDIFYATMPDNMYRHKTRPVVIVSNNIGNEYSARVTVVPLTTQEKKPQPTHCEIVSKVLSTALCEDVQNIPKDCLGDFVRCCTEEEMKRIDECLLCALGIEKGTAEASEDKKHQAAVSIKEQEPELKKALLERELYKNLYEQLLEKTIG